MKFNLNDLVIVSEIEDFGRKMTLTNGIVTAVGISTMTFAEDEGTSTVTAPQYEVSTNTGIKRHLSEYQLGYSYKLKMLDTK